MSVQQCANAECRRYYWRYRGDYPPKRYCSMACHTERHKKSEPVEIPELARAVLDRLMQHRIEICELIDGQYAKALRDAADAVTAEVV